MSVDAVVVGGGPNGLAAAITIARAGHSVTVLEANADVGGAVRTAELTQPGFRHDLGSAIHPLAVASPFFASLDLERHGLRWITPEASVAHPLDDGRAAISWRSLDRAVDGLGSDGRAYRRLFEPFVDAFPDLVELSLGPLVRIPSRPIFAARFGAVAALPAATLARRLWKTDEAQALFAGHAAHAILPLGRPLTSAFGLLLGAAAHAVGWPFPEGGAQAVTDALVAELDSLGGTIVTDAAVEAMTDIPDARAVIFAIGPDQVATIAGERLGSSFTGKLRRFRYGPGAWKVDFALSEPIPWTAPDVHRAATVHVGGTLDEIVAAEAAVGKGHTTTSPFVLLAQHTIDDPTRAPDGGHTAWAYCHVPNGSTVDHTEAIVGQIERFAPGFRDVVIDQTVSSPAALHTQNRNLVGGDVGGGSNAGRQLVARPVSLRRPHDTPDPSIFLGSASTAPGGGVHGMGGVGAAERAISTVLR